MVVVVVDEERGTEVKDSSEVEKRKLIFVERAAKADGESVEGWCVGASGAGALSRVVRVMWRSARGKSALPELVRERRQRLSLGLDPLVTSGTLHPNQ